MEAIVNVDQNWGIGCGGKLLFPIPEDLRFFKETTTGNVVVMGRKTLASLPGGKPLPNRENIVFTRNPAFRAPPEITICHTPAELGQALKKFPDKKAYVSGGQEIYSLLLPYCSGALVTHVMAGGDADTWFPNLSTHPHWQLAEKSDEKVYNGVSYYFCRYQNRNVLELA